MKYDVEDNISPLIGPGSVVQLTQGTFKHAPTAWLGSLDSCPNRRFPKPEFQVCALYETGRTGECFGSVGAAGAAAYDIDACGVVPNDCPVPRFSHSTSSTIECPYSNMTSSNQGSTCVHTRDFKTDRLDSVFYAGFFLHHLLLAPPAPLALLGRSFSWHLSVLCPLDPLSLSSLSVAQLREKRGMREKKVGATPDAVCSRPEIDPDSVPGLCLRRHPSPVLVGEECTTAQTAQGRRLLADAVDVATEVRTSSADAAAAVSAAVTAGALNTALEAARSCKPPSPRPRRSRW
eukprot:3226778-Rhodomonas_salina.1